jgi:hypothetical protein
VRMHPVPLARDCRTRHVGVWIRSLLPTPREVRLKGARYREPFGVV